MSDDLVMDAMARIAGLERRLDDTVITGIVSEVQNKPYRVRVNYGTPDAPLTTALLPVMVPRAAGAKVWWPLEVGEAVLVLSPGGDTQQGRVIPASYSQAQPQPDDQAERLVIEFGGGNSLSLDRDAGKLTLTLKGDIEINAPNRLRVNSQVIECSGDVLDTAGSNTASMRAMRATYDQHTHTGDNGGNTSTPHQGMG